MLEGVVQKITARLGTSVTNAERSEGKWTLPVLLPEQDSDGDGVPGARDKWPHDPRRSEEILVKYITTTVKRLAPSRLGTALKTRFSWRSIMRVAWFM
jgi:hypothetical protein